MGLHVGLDSDLTSTGNRLPEIRLRVRGGGSTEAGYFSLLGHGRGNLGHIGRGDLPRLPHLPNAGCGFNVHALRYRSAVKTYSIIQGTILWFIQGQSLGQASPRARGFPHDVGDRREVASHRADFG
jgi:hypothetical protein